MLTGRRAFDGDDISTTLASVLKTEPDWHMLPPTTPAGFRRLLVRCLKKDPKDRLQAIGDARVEIGELLSGHSEDAALLTITPGRTYVRDRLRVFAAGALLAFIVTAAVAGWLWWERRAAEPAKVAFDIVTDISLVPNQFSLSPDGTRLVAVITTPSGPALWLRRLDEVDGHNLVASAGTASFYPFWSADSRFLTFFANGKLNKIDVSGGPAQALCDVQSGQSGGGGTWNRDGVILFAASTSEGPLFSVAAGGGVPHQVTALDRVRGDTAHMHPKFLPDGQHFIFLVRSTTAENTGLYLGSLGSQETRRLVASEVMGVFAAPDHLLFVHDATLLAQRFNTRRFELEGDPVPVVQDIGTSISGNGVAAIAASDAGVLAYRIGSAERVLRWVDRTGKFLSEIGEAGAHGNAVLAPSGERLADTQLYGGTGDIWTVDLQRGSSSRFTFGPALNDNPIWSPDQQHIVFASTRNGGVRNLYLKNASGAGSEELLLKTDRDKFPTDWSRDGQYILYTEASSPRQVWALPMKGDRKPIPVLNTSANENSARFSPDGHWVAYSSYETGAPRVYVQTFPPGGGKWQVSVSGTAYDPRWRGDGRELFYTDPTGVWSVDVTTTTPTTFTKGVPRKLFDTTGLAGNPLITRYDVTADGQRLLLNVANRPPRAIRVVLNWATPSKP
jgi:hypothetical protein